MPHGLPCDEVGLSRVGQRIERCRGGGKPVREVLSDRVATLIRSLPERREYGREDLHVPGVQLAAEPTEGLVVALCEQVQHPDTMRLVGS